MNNNQTKQQIRAFLQENRKGKRKGMQENRKGKNMECTYTNRRTTR